MNLKTILIGLLLLAAVFYVMAFETYLFPGWRGLANISASILIATCRSSPEAASSNDRFVKSEIELVSVLKGRIVPAGTRATLESQYWPYQGGKYLIFATYYDGSQCQALDDYRVVPLGHYFPTNMLSGKSLDEQIKALLQYRLNNLNRELEHGQTEKKRLEEAFPAASSPPASQK